ncbi:MAG: MoxR family ATPase [Spirochaetes bacterium]|jgi:MoxR-like ATPase|nr:MoxR family ATPase [Spirochaetota bacterium]
MINIPSEIKSRYKDEGYEVIGAYSFGGGIPEPQVTMDQGDFDQSAPSRKTDMPHVITSSTEKVPDKKSEISSLAAVSSGEYHIPTIIEYLNWHMKRISENVIGRDEIIRQAIYAILTGEHMLLLSRTGMAKSYLTNYIFNTFEGARIFSSQASKDQTPDNYFGPYNIDEFKKGRIRHNIKGSIIEANLVFLDEFFDASDVVLRSLLSVLNERKFINGSEQIDVAVHSAIATANYMRMNEVTEAVLDRFTYKSIIPEDNNVYSQLLIDHTYAFSGGKPMDPEKKMYFNQILYLHDIIKNNNKAIKVEISDFLYFMKNTVINRFVSEMRKSDYNYFVSPRKRAKLADFMRASALINNRFSANEEDLKELYLALCTLNSYVSVKAKDKSEVDVYLDAYQQTMVHFNATGAIPQLEFLLNVRRLLQEIRETPEKRDMILEKKGLVQGLRDILKKIFPQRRRADEESKDKMTIEALKNSVVELNPAVEEARELKEGILRDYRDIY